MTDDPTSQSWWRTLPGLLTAGAAIITATTGLLALLFQNGIIGGTRPSDTRRGTSVASASGSSSSTSRPDTSPSNTPTYPAGALTDWSKSDVALTANDGKVTTLRAETLSNCISTNHDLTLDGGQDIPFEKIRSLEVLRADPLFAPNGKATLAATLLDGQTLQDTVGGNCDLFGYNDLGRFSVYFQKLKRVDFKR